MKKNYCTIYLTRHGETEWNVKKLIQGQNDIPLNKKGKEQAEKLSEKLKKIKFDLIYSSDLKRASETAKIIAGKRELKIIKSKALRERHFGKYQGVSFKKSKAIFEIINNLKTNEKKDAKVEDEQKVIKRFINYIREVSIQNLDKTILIVTHAGPIRLFLINLSFRIYKNLSEGNINNLSYVQLISDGVSFEIEKTKGIK
ncbi:Alpha-ribazole phosphatase [Candidatus Roizmanbacteria bacterium]|mgnify:CR=1 FL=1|nr:Alpha-ribazole phosphatase [Candidatus Roizmanbacteria bacterium]